MKLLEILYEDYYDDECEECSEVVYVTEDGEVIEEGFQRQMKKVNGKVKKQYRCTSGPKKGMIVAEPSACAKRKDPKKRRHGKKVARRTKGVRKFKTKIAKKRPISKRITRINRRLSGKSSS